MISSVTNMFSMGVAGLLLFFPVAVDAAAAADKFSGLQEINLPAAPEAGTVKAIVGATLIDGRGGTPVQDSVVVIRDNKIVAVGPRSTVEIPEEANLVDATGLTLLPGLIDAHFHIGDNAKMYDPPPLFLSHGVTSARDPGRPIEAYKPFIQSSRLAPRLFLCGPHFDQAPPAWPNNAVLLETPDEARLAVKRYFKQGASAIKVYFRLPLELIQATCETAHELGIPVTAHLELVDADKAIEAGLDGIEHITSFGTALADRKVTDRFRYLVGAENEARKIERYRLWASLDLDESPRVGPLLETIIKHDVFVSPTLATFERRTGDKKATDLAHIRGFQNMLKFTGICDRAGATVVVGSHTWSTHVELGWAYQREMELLVEAGMTPMKVIGAATLQNARFFGCAERLGSIEPGKLADLVLVEGDPLDDIRAMYNIRRVMLNGRWVETIRQNAKSAQETSHGRNHDEAEVGSYTLPDPLLGKEGKRIANAESWNATRRGEILSDFRDLMYGHTPELSITLRAEILATRRDAMEGLATRSLVRLHLFEGPNAPRIDLMLYVPNTATKPVPVLLGLSFNGNASVEPDPAIPLSQGWMRASPTAGAVVENRATESLRGIHSERWPVKLALERGYGVATFYYGDVEPDHIEGWRDGIRGYALKLAGRTKRDAHEWGAIGAWAWGLSRALDYLETNPAVDAGRVAVFGHSRLGKTALWAGAQDERFALVISNNSGEGGASLARRNFGENIAFSIAHASWRYCDRFRDSINRENDLPFDQHMLLSLIAPRPVYIASATEDSLADPKGEFLSAVHAEPVYRLFGKHGVNTSTWPAPDTPIGESIGYHLRTGGHDITAYDWEQYIRFADRHF